MKEAARSALLAACFMLVSYMAYSSIVKMEAKCSFETSVYFEWITRHCIPEDKTHYNHRSNNLESTRTFKAITGSRCASGQ
jgi:hypothetical protein